MIKNRILLAAILLSALAFTGCKATEIDLQALAQEIDAMTVNTMHWGVYYIGTDENYHYIYVDWRMRKNKSYKISVDTLSMPNAIKPNKNKSNWREIVPEVFAKPPSEYDRLFMLKENKYFIKKASNKAL